MKNPENRRENNYGGYDEVTCRRIAEGVAGAHPDVVSCRCVYGRPLGYIALDLSCRVVSLRVWPAILEIDAFSTK